MKIALEEEHTIVAKAILRDDQLTLAVSIITPYGEKQPRTSTYTVPVVSPEIQAEVQQALAAAIKTCLYDALPEARARAQRCHLVAIDRGEVI